jgi:hypothetical protein
VTTAGELIRNQLNASINNKVWSDLLYNVKVYDAKGDGATDDTAAIQLAINAANSAGGGEVWFTPGTYRTTDTLTLYSNVKLKGTNATLYCDFSGDYGVKAQGSVGAGITTTADINAGATTISLDSSSLAVGDTILIKAATSNGNRFPYMFRKITAKTTTTITIDLPIPIGGYTIANTTSVSKFTPVENIGIEGMTIQFADTSDIKWGIGLVNVQNVGIKNNKTVGHRYATNPAAAIVFRVDTAFRVTVEYNTDIGVNDDVMNAGNYISVLGTENTQILNNYGTSVAFGIGLWLSWGGLIEGNQLTGSRANGNRGIKVAGCYYVRVVSNRVQNFDAGFKIEDTWHTTVLGNDVVSCIGNGINCSSQYSFGYEGLIIEANKVSETGEIGIYVDGNTKRGVINSNTVQNTTLHGIYVSGEYFQITNNRVSGFHVIGVLFNPREAIVKTNHVYDSDNTKPSYGITTVTNASTCIFTENISVNNPLDTANDITSVGYFGNNNVTGVSERKFIANTKRGTATISLSAASSGSVVVTFPVPFPTGVTPVVVAVPNASVLCIAVSSINNNQFTASVAHKDGTSITATVTIQWIAMMP